MTFFNFEPGTNLANKYEVDDYLGGGWEGEVFKVREKTTGIIRAAKFFYPKRNLNNRSIKFYARKLHKLRHCPILIQYHTQERIEFRGLPIDFLISEYVEGEKLTEFLDRQKRQRMSVFEALHLLHALAIGVEKIHHAREYHGDLHSDNILIRRRGISFEVKLIDMFYSGPPRGENIRRDVCDLVRIFYDALGGPKHYAKHPLEVRQICCGLKRSLLIRKFRTAGQLRTYIETMEWSS